MESIFESFPAILQIAPNNDDVREAFVFAAWRQCAGEMLSEQTVPVKLVEGRLVVAVSSNVWKRHLEDMAPQILYKLNAALGVATVKFIEFCIDEKAVSVNRSDYRRSDGPDVDMDSAALEEITPELRRAAAAISHEGLREQFLLAAGSCLARKKRNLAAGII